MMTRAALLSLAFLLLPIAAQAQSDDAAYCANMSALANRYVQTPYDRGAPDIELANAVYDCQKGNFARSIPVLERKLRNNGFTLPKR
jgi:hypothetical protein